MFLFYAMLSISSYFHLNYYIYFIIINNMPNVIYFVCFILFLLFVVFFFRYFYTPKNYDLCLDFYISCMIFLIFYFLFIIFFFFGTKKRGFSSMFYCHVTKLLLNCADWLIRYLTLTDLLFNIAFTIELKHD